MIIRGETYLTVRVAAIKAQVTENTIRQWVRDGSVRADKFRVVLTTKRRGKIVKRALDILHVNLSDVRKQWKAMGDR